MARTSLKTSRTSLCWSSCGWSISNRTSSDRDARVPSIRLDRTASRRRSTRERRCGFGSSRPAPASSPIARSAEDSCRMRAELRGSTGGKVGGTKARYPRSARTTWSRCPTAKSSISTATYLPSIDPSATDQRFEYHFGRRMLRGYHEHEWATQPRTHRSTWGTALRPRVLPVQDELGDSEVVGAGAIERASQIADLIGIWPFRAHLDQGQAIVVAKVLGREHFVVGDGEVVRSSDPALDLDLENSVVGGDGANVEAGVVVRHLLRDSAKRMFCGED